MFVVLNIAWSKGYIMEFNKKYFPQKKPSEVNFSIMLLPTFKPQMSEP